MVFGLLAVVVVTGGALAWWVRERPHDRRTEELPFTQPTSVRILRTPEEVRDATRRAAEREHELHRQISGRISERIGRYEELGSTEPS